MVKDRETRSGSTPAIERGVGAGEIAAAILSYLGVAVASTVWWADRVNADLPCTAGGGCEQVANSSYAHLTLFGQSIPVALLGVAGYVLLFTLSLLRIAIAGAKMRRALTLASLVISAGGTLYSWYLQYVAHFKIGAFCPWCFTSALLMTGLCATLVWSAAQSMPEPAVDSDLTGPAGKRARQLASKRRRVLLAAWAASLAIVPLVASKLADRPRTTVPAAPTFGSTATLPAPGTPSSSPTNIDIDFPTWVNILQHTDSQPRGPFKAPYTLVEFGDFQCPTCARTRPLIENVVDHAKVNMFFINYPLPEHKWAVPAAEAAFAAAEQGKFWPMYDALYAHQSDLEPSHYAAYAREAGVNLSRFAADIESHKYLPKVNASKQFCNSVKITATPTVVVHNNLTGDTFVAVGLAQIQTALATTDWHAYDSVDLDHYGQTPPPASKHTSGKRHSG
jgi:protein-disulfide isomerase